jgi:hypothetical protein
MATIREYGRKCWHHVHAAWQTGELILGIGVAAVSYFGLSAAPVPPWLVYVGAIVFTLLYFIAIVQFRVWRTEAIQVQSLEAQLRPASKSISNRTPKELFSLPPRYELLQSKKQTGTRYRT